MQKTILGPHAYLEILESKEIDAVVIATPPYFHVQHLAAAVDAGKHVYCEKPVAIDVPGTKHVLEIGKKAEGKLSLDVGFQIRMAPPYHRAGESHPRRGAGRDRLRRGLLLLPAHRAELSG